MTAWFVTGTDTEIGKTLVTCALLHGLARAGLKAAGLKPVAAGADLHAGQWRNEDCEKIMQASSASLPRDWVAPYLLREPMAPHLAARREGRQITLQPMLDAFGQARQSTQALVVEGVGGFCVPLAGDLDTADLAQALGLPVLLVVGMRLGCINHALLTAAAIAQRNLPLAGWVANTVDPNMAGLQDNIGALRERLNAPCLGAIPRLDYPDAAAAAAHLDFTRLAGWPELQQ